VRSKAAVAVLCLALAPGGWAAGPLPDFGAAGAGFAQVLGPRVFEFPRDHGAHPEYRQEWWYFTGNLQSVAGERFGFELTFFRYGLAAGQEAKADAESAWRARQIYMAHFAVTDVGQRRFRSAEKVSRGAVGLAGARNPPLRVWVDDWVLGEVGEGVKSVGAGGVGAPDVAASSGGRDFGRWTLHAAESGYELTLDAEALEAPVLNGDRGFSAKSSVPGAASYYYSIPRVAVHGRLIRDGKSIDVHGLAWMDREWGSGPLDRQGWDWFALQLRDGSSLMFYSLHNRDGSRDSHSAGTWVSSAGAARPLAAGDVQIDVLDYWKNVRGERYPSRWRVRVPAVGVDVEVRPVLADQELTTAPRYWEGAVDVVVAGDGRATGEPRAEGRNAGAGAAAKGGGRGYVELVGYAAQ
jgi:predicted secreted hydrolase